MNKQPRVVVVVVVVVVVAVVVSENPGNFEKKKTKFSKNPKIFENFPVAPGRSLGYPGRSTGNFSKKLGFLENFNFFSWIFPDFKPKNAKNRGIFEEPARSGNPELKIHQKSIKNQLKIYQNPVKISMETYIF